VPPGFLFHRVNWIQRNGRCGALRCAAVRCAALRCPRTVLPVRESPRSVLLLRRFPDGNARVGSRRVNRANSLASNGYAMGVQF